MRLIGCAGKAGAGKTTFADVAVQEHGFTKIALGDALKEEVSQFLTDLGVSFEPRHLYGTLLDKAETFTCGMPDWQRTDYRPRRVLNPHVVFLTEGDRISMSYRKLLQLWGTEYRRAQDPEYWVKKAVAAIEKVAGPVVIDDVRFKDEARMVQKMNGVLIRIHRRGVVPLDHASETALDDFREWDWQIFNNGGLKDYRDEVRRCLGVMK